MAFEKVEDDHFHFVSSSKTRYQFATILAMKSISDYLNNTEQSPANTAPFESAKFSTREYCQLIYAMHEKGVFQNENLKQIRVRFEKAFGRKLPKVHSHWSELKSSDIKNLSLFKSFDRALIDRLIKDTQNST